MVLDVLDQLGMVFYVLDRGKSLLLPSLLIRESFDNFVSNCGSVEMSVLFLKKVFFFFFFFFLIVHD